jgi:hypothetical protein
MRILLLLSIVILGSGCERKYEGKRLLLEWTDPNSGTVFRITELPGAMVKQNCRLHVQRDDVRQERLIDDDAKFSTVAFVRYDHWLLVVCRGVNEVWAGYDYNSGKLYGEYDWSSLPFTLWAGEGTVVAEQKVGDASYSPANFPRKSFQQRSH